MFVATHLISWTLPDAQTSPTRPELQDLTRVLSHPVLAPLLVVGALHGLTLTTYDHLFAMLVDHRGLPGTLTGGALALGVLVEVCVLWAAPRLLDRWGPVRMMTVAVSLGIPRWLMTGLVASPVVLVGAQSLHGLSFGLYWVSGVALFSEHAPKQVGASSQALFTTATFGVGYLFAMGGSALVLRFTDTDALFSGLTLVSALATLLMWKQATRSADLPDAEA